MPHNMILPFAGGAGAVILFLLFSRRSGGSGSSAPTIQPPADYHFRLAQLEAKVSFLMETLGVAYDVPADDEIQGFLARGMKIEAIKAYRVKNPGVGLKDAKDAVDALDAQLKAKQQ